MRCMLYLRVAHWMLRIQRWQVMWNDWRWHSFIFLSAYVSAPFLNTVSTSELLRVGSPFYAATLCPICPSLHLPFLFVLRSLAWSSLCCLCLWATVCKSWETASTEWWSTMAGARMGPAPRFCNLALFQFGWRPMVFGTICAVAGMQPCLILERAYKGLETTSPVRMRAVKPLCRSQKSTINIATPCCRRQITFKCKDLAVCLIHI